MNNDISTNDTILSVQNLTTSFKTEAGIIRAVDNVSFDLKKGKTLGLVGESGCGKSVTALSIMRLLPKPHGFIENGQIIFNNKDLIKLPADDMHEIRGKNISMIFQEPLTALNPVHKIGDQIKEVFNIHFPGMVKDETKDRSIELLKSVGIPTPDKRMNEYPHQLSGGMRQRVMIAMALACKPQVLIADEPTTAIDVTIQAQILELIKELQIQTGMSIIFITHDLGVIAETSDDVVVMYAGNIIEKASVDDLFNNPSHPYTKGLLSSIPRLSDKPKTKLNTIKGLVPTLYELPKGCRFENRCPYAMEICKETMPETRFVSKAHSACCYLISEK